MPSPPAPKRYAFRHLAELAGIPPRTLRFYIARGLVAGPGKAGRGATYGDSHLRQVREVRRLQDGGLTLAEIGHRLAIPAGRAPLPAAEVWRHVRVAEDLVLMVRDPIAPWRLRQIQRAAADLCDRLNTPTPPQESSP